MSKDKSNVQKEKKSRNMKASLKTAKAKTTSFFKLLVESITYKLVIFAILAVYLVYSFSAFRTSVQKQINKNTKAHLSEIVNESLEKVHIKINDEFIVVHTMTQFYDNDIDLELTKKMLTDTLHRHSFEGISIVDTEKKEVLSVGNTSEFDNDKFIDKALSGKDSVSQIYSINDTAEYISLAVPVWDTNSDTVVGAMICNYGIEALTGILDTSTFEQIGTTFISQEDGTLVARPKAVKKNTNLYSLLNTLDINNTKSVKQLQKYLKNGSSGILTYGKGTKKIYICYNVIPDTDWYSVSIVSASTIEPIVKKLSNLSYSFAIELGVVIGIYMIIILGIDMAVLHKKMEDKNKK